MLDSLLAGFTNEHTRQLLDERKQQRDREDQQLAWQMEQLQKMRDDPNTDPATLGKIMSDMQATVQARTNPKLKKGFDELMPHELPISQVLTHLANGTISHSHITSPSGQAMIQGMLKNGVQANPVDAYTSIGEHKAKGKHPIFPPPAIPMPSNDPTIMDGPGTGGLNGSMQHDNGLADAQGQPQAAGGAVGATPAMVPPVPPPPPPQPPVSTGAPGTGQMAGAAPQMMQEQEGLTPPPQAQPNPPAMTPPPGPFSELVPYGHTHTDEEERNMRFSDEHMAANKARAGAMADTAKKEAEFKAEMALWTKEFGPDVAKQMMAAKLNGHVSYQSKSFEGPNGETIIAHRNPRDPNGTWLTDDNQPIPAGTREASLANRDRVVVDTPNGGKAVGSKSQPGNEVKPIKGTEGTKLVGKIQGNMAGPDGAPGFAIVKPDGTTQWIGAAAVKDQYKVITGQDGNQELHEITPSYKAPSGGGARSKIPTAPGGAATPPGAPKLGDEVGIPAPPVAPSQRNVDKVVANYGPKYKELNTNDKLAVQTIDEATSEYRRVMKQMEDLGIQNDTDWATPKVQSWLYKHGFSQGDNVNDMLQSTGFARAHLLKGLIGGRLAKEIAMILDEHMPNGAQSPALMYHQMDALINRELPQKRDTIFGLSPTVLKPEEYKMKSRYGKKD